MSGGNCRSKGNFLRTKSIVLVKLLLLTTWISTASAASSSPLLPDGTVRPDSRILIPAGEEREFLFRPEGVRFLAGRARIMSESGFTDKSGQKRQEITIDDTNRTRGTPWIAKKQPFRLRIKAETDVIIEARGGPEWRAEERQRAEEARRKAEQEQRERWEAQQRAEQARQAKERADKEAARQTRWNEFVRKYGVQELVRASDLFVNPFVYERKTVAVELDFQRMLTANSAMFTGRSDAIFVLSNIPTATYRSERQGRDILAVRFIGMTEIKGLPMVSSMQVPNLRFVGVHFCQESGCSDILQK